MQTSLQMILHSSAPVLASLTVGDLDVGHAPSISPCFRHCCETIWSEPRIHQVPKTHNFYAPERRT